jgi:O-Antigen ligase
MTQRYSLLYARILRYGIIAVIVVAPFYAPMSVWLASGLQHFDFFKIWKEFVLCALALIAIGFLITHRSFMAKFKKNPLMFLIVAYVCMIAVYGVYNILSESVSRNAVIYGMLIDIRPLAIFTVSFLSFAIILHNKHPRVNWQKIVLIPALFVVLFGFLQITVLPKDILTNIGYSDSTIAPYQTVDNQPDIVRVESTLRGPNPLGAYLLLVITIVSVLVIMNKKYRWYGLIFIAASLIVLVGTYSRSAEIGVIISLFCAGFIYKGKYISRHLIWAGAIIIVVAAGMGVLVLNNNYFAQNIILHSSQGSHSSVSSNDERLAALERAIKDVYHNPIGHGVGAAGPASARNEKDDLRIAENYFLQVGQEIGILGMGLFIAINIMIGRLLWQRRDDPLALALFASLIGLTFVNLLSHAWTDDTLAYVFWGLAGIALAPVILEMKEHKK